MFLAIILPTYSIFNAINESTYSVFNIINMPTYSIFNAIVFKHYCSCSVNRRVNRVNSVNYKSLHNRNASCRLTAACHTLTKQAFRKDDAVEWHPIENCSSTAKLPATLPANHGAALFPPQKKSPGGISEVMG